MTATASRAGPAAILGYFPDREAAVSALQRIRRSGFYRSAVVEPVSHRRLFGGAFRFGLSERVLAHYRRWLMPDEALVVVHVPPDRAGQALAVLRSETAFEPSTFVLHPHAEPAVMPGQVGSRPERFTTELIRRRAARLAVSQRVATPTPSWWRRRPLWDGLKRSEWVVDSVTRVLTEAARSGRHVSLAGQWLLDNAYVVRRQIGDVRRNFSRSLYDVLPLLQGGTHGGEPRIYELALEFVAHSEAQVNLPELTEFLRAFQRVQPLTMAELWAMPLTLRLALIESVAYVALETDRRHAEHDRADFWANRLLDAARRDPDHLLFMLGELARDVPAPSPFFVDGLFSQLEGEALALDPIQAWLERKVGAPVADVIQREQLRQATDQVMIANAIGSLRLLAELDWREVFEQVSPVHEALCQDPSGVYATMDFATRDHYRHAVEEIAHPVRGAGITATAETAVAQAAVRAAAEAAPDTLERHVGYFLLGAGRRDLEAERGSVIPRRVRVRRRIRRRPAATYVGGIALATAALIASFVALTPTLTNDSGSGGALLLILAALAVIPLSEVATQLVNYAVTRLLPPDVLPKLSFGDGIPDAWRTLVVVPMLLTRRDVERELERLEVRFLGNRDPNLHFALLADFTDAPQQDMPGDEALIAAAVDGTEQLNRAYGTRQFSLFYRQRLWSDTEQVWMGWERKRGKLEELNQLLVQLSAPDADSPPSALTHVGGVALDDLADTRFVITLDSDTQLPHDSARRLVETLAHPLNRPRLAPDGHTVSGGYAIIQPRVSTSLPSATATRFSRVFTDPVGTDPYTRTVSDVYQDLAGEGSYHGKGIYDLQAFHAVLGGRFPDALLLSHDLVEGAHVRVGLATDVEVFDLFPSNYPAYASREHRWIRGDWQIAQWCTPWVPTAAGRLTRNRISMLNRWKIFDNLRRSLVPPAAVALLAAGWLLFPAAAWLSTSLVALMLLLPLVLGLLTWLLSQPGVALRPWRGTQGWKEQRPAWIRVAFQAAFLPHQSLVALDAIWRVFHRRALSRRSLLQWQTSGAAQTSGAGARRLEWQVGAVTLCAASLAVAVVAASASSLPAALPFIALWLLAPAGLVWLSGRSPAHGLDPLPAADRAFLGRLARQTWRYFDDFVGPQSSWLPPDNYQAALQVEVAARTSPTNVGLWLLSTLAAHDFGYLTLDQMIERGAATFETLQRLERCEGHLLNWYDTGTLQPLSPRYVSTVDSGNLLASLWAFGQGYAQKLSQPVLGPQSLYGLRNTVAALQEALVKAPPTAVTAARARQVVGRLSALTESPLDDVADIVARLRQAVVSAGELESLLEPVTAGYWATQIRRQIQAHLDIADRYLAWIGPGVAAPSLRALASGGDGNEQEGLADAVSRARWLAGEVLARAEDVMAQAEQIAGEMNMQFLFNAGRKLFSIGYSVDERRLDRSHYDLLASESRLASLVAIARGDVPVEHWLALGRTFGRTGGRAVLLSWTGTMFEYLMPLLLTRTYENSLLDAACRAAVATQIEDGARRAVPWGVSEAAYSAVDAHRIYQYQAFGVPGLGLKRGLEDDLVVAPYATALALAIAPHAAVRNLRTLERAGLAGDYGSFESIDYTPRRLGAGESRVVVYTYMAHHQGMTLVALDNALHHNVMPARFHADPRIRATESLLFERVPLAPAVAGAASREAARGRVSAGAAAEAGRRYSGVDSRVPRVQLLANPSYALMVTSAGGGYSRWRGLDVTRWSADTTRDSGGSFIYLRDLDDGTLWSAAHHPVGRPATRYSAYLSPARVEFDRQDVGIGTRTEIAVSSEDDVEVRRVTLANLSDRVRRVEITSYAELALAAHAADRAHPAFSKMFVQTQALPGAAGAPPALLAWRSPRGQHDPAIWAAHVLALPPAIGDARPPPGVQYETNRDRFLGRGRSAQRPVALEGDLSNAAGHVLDPIFSLRCRVALEPGERFQLAFVTGAAEDRVGVLTLAEKYRDLRAVDRALELAWSQAQLVQRQMRVTVDDQERFRRLASHVLFPSPALRATERQLRKNRLGQARLWAHGISGDLPIVLVQIGDSSDLELVRESLLAHAQWRMQGLKADLVILDEEAVGYEQPLRDTLQRLVQVSGLVTGVDQPGGIFLRREAHLPAEDVDLLLATACVVLVAARGSLAQQLAALAERPKLPAPLGPGLRLREDPSTPLAFMELPYFNGYGGFTPDGREYAIYLGPGTHTPAPWINIMANPHFGALVSEAGQGFVWYGNSQTNRLLPWSNDPVVDPCADAIYIRDETSGVFWTPTAAPVRELDAYRARHGQGYTVFEHNSHAIEQELLVCVPVDDDGGVPVRLQRLRLRNRSSRPRRLSVIAYAEWVLGASREETHTHVVTSWDAEANALLAVNHYHPQWSGRVAFAGASRSVTSFTADRTEFLGRNGSAGRPAAMAARALSGQVGAGLDPCAALQVNVELEPGEETEVVFVLGQAADAAQARALARACREPSYAEATLVSTREWWDRLLETVQVQTPDASINFLLNRWLPYQTLSCRIWGRSAFYQSGGAFGFRDQLQDGMALVYARPALLRELILTAAAHQFLEGDVQHWWHAESGAGIRTRFSDDLLWLPFVTAHYVRVTGDTSVLDEPVPFLEGRLLNDGEHEAYFVPTTSLELGTLLEHCRRAISRGLTAGRHGLPLIGTGDWNDGMNLVGAGGKGESVWLAWFLIDVLNGFAGVVEHHAAAGANVVGAARAYRDHAQRIAAAVEQSAWDGEWYLRAFFDDGTPLGSKQSAEAQIDSLPQSWAVLSGAGDASRTRQALAAVNARLVRATERLVLLFAPPFEKPSHDPGYIKDYPPGVRENGGQYTHGAIWLAMAHARLGDGDEAVRLLRLLNPVESARTPEAAQRYRVEPYAVAADVYALDRQVGRGGWTWYTGSSGWMYRVWLEDVLGFKLGGDRLELAPVFPAAWDGCSLRYRHRGARHETLYVIALENPSHVGHGVAWVEVDGRRLSEPSIQLMDDGAEHRVVVRLGHEDSS